MPHNPDNTGGATDTTGGTGGGTESPGPGWGRTHRTLGFGVGPEWSTHQLALTAANTAGAAVFLAALHQASGGFDGIWWLLLVVPATTMSFAGSGLLLGYYAVLLAGWFYLTPAGSFSWWSVPAAAGLLLSHTASALSATAPPAAQLTRNQLERRLRPTAIAFAAAVVTAAAAAWLSGRGLGPNPAALGLGLVGVTLGVWALRRNPPRPRD